MNEFDFITERSHNQNREKAYKKISKQVLYDGEVYKSGRAVARHFKLSCHQSIYAAIKRGTFKGKPIEYVKE